MFRSNLIKEWKSSNVCFVQMSEPREPTFTFAPDDSEADVSLAWWRLLIFAPVVEVVPLCASITRLPPSFLILILIFEGHFLVDFPCQTYVNKICYGTAYSRNYSFYSVGGFILGRWTAEGGMHFEKKKSVVCERILFITTQKSSSWREGVRKPNSKISLLMFQSRDLLHQAPCPWRGEGNICLS